MRKVGVHLRAFPIASEAFVVEQARTLLRYEPVFLVRELLRKTEFECRAIETRPAVDKARRRLFAVAPGAWAFGGRRALADIDLLHAHFGPNGVYAAPVARALKVPLVVTFHGFDATLSRSELLKNQGLYGLYYLLRRASLRRSATLVIAVSAFIAARLRAMGFPAGRIVQHYIGVDVERFEPAPASERSADIVCVARLTRSKGVGDLIQAFAKIAGALPASKLRLIGDGPARAEFVRLAAELGLADRVVFEGSMPHPAVAARVRLCALSVLASKTGSDGWQEAFGLASIEAAAAGLPVIVSTNGGLPESVVDGETGLLFAEGDVQALSSGMLRLMRDDATRQAMGAAGRRRVVEQFDLRRQTAQLETIYDRALLQ